MNCWKCGSVVSELTVKIAFRAVCSHCDVDLHVCKNCRYFSPGKPNDCLIPETDFIADREVANFCEEFKPKIPSSPASSDRAKRLFGEEPPKRDFKSLFKDEENNS